MKRILLILVAVLLCSVCLVRAESGADKYCPTKLEWFVMELNSKNIFNDSSGDGFSLAYYAQRPDTIILSVNYFPFVKKDYVFNIIKREVDFLNDIVKIKEWDGMNVRVETHLLKELSKRENKLKTFLAKE